MASPVKTGSKSSEIVARFDSYCCKCRGKIFSGTRIWWDGEHKGQVWHVECPPVVNLAPRVYQAPPADAPTWKRLCKQVMEKCVDKPQERKVLPEDLALLGDRHPVHLVPILMERLRLKYYEGEQIVREYLAWLKAPLDTREQTTPGAIGGSVEGSDPEGFTEWEE